MGGVRTHSKALVVPLVVLAFWLFPSNSPAVVVAGVVETPTSVLESLADAAPTTKAFAPVAPVALVAPSSGTVTTNPLQPPASSTTTSVLPSTTDGVVAPETPAPTTTARSIPLGQQALDRVAFDWRTRFPNWLVEFRSAREGIRALTYPSERRIEVFVRPSDTAATLHRVFSHELGHLVDVELNSDEDRAIWFETRGIDQSTPWWPSASAPDFDTGAGDFAEAFAVWETGVSSRSTVGDQPDAADLGLLRDLAAG